MPEDGTAALVGSVAAWRSFFTRLPPVRIRCPMLALKVRVTLRNNLNVGNRCPGQLTRCERECLPATVIAFQHINSRLIAVL